MLRCRGDLLALTLLLGGCALPDGDPWGRASVQMEARFAPEAGRLDEAGRLKTTTNYSVQIDRLSLRFDSFSIAMSAEGAEVTAFDPANPPPGYTLCHNGHCHSVDGRLVDYEDIALELTGGVAAGATITQAFSEGLLDLGPETIAVPTGACANDCQLPRGGLSTATLVVGQIEVEGRVFDRLTGDRRRLPESGAPFSLSAERPLSFALTLSGAVGKDEPVAVDFDGLFEAPSALFDGLDWQAYLSEPTGSLTLPAEAATQILDLVEAEGALNLAVSR